MIVNISQRQLYMVVTVLYHGNIKTIRGVRAITNLKGYKPIEIVNPSVLLESEV